MSRSARYMSVILALTLFCTSSLINIGAPVNAASGSTKKSAAHGKSELIVKFKSESKGQAAKNNVKGKLKLQKLEAKQKFNRTQAELLEVGAGDNVDKVVEELSKDPNVAYVQPNYVLTATSVADARFPEQWGLQNNAQTVGQQMGTPGLDIKAVDAWGVTEGAPDVVVGVLDTGIDVNHTDLTVNVFRNANEISGNGLDDDGNGLADDVNGWDFANGDNSVFDGTAEDEHGTHVAGIIAAAANQDGIRGVAPGVKVLPLKFISGGKGYTSDAIEAIEYAKQMGVRIINASFGGPDNNQALKDEMAASDILFVAAAGNDGKDLAQNPIYPAAYGLPNVLAVGAVDNKGNRASFSNYGTLVEAVAPGVGILSTVPQNGYDLRSGTSMAAAVVTGIAALAQSQFPDLNSKQLAARVKGSVTPVSSIAGSFGSAGLVNALSALGGLAQAPAEETPAPQTTPAPSGDGEGVISTLAAAISPQLQEEIHYGEKGVSVASGNYSKTFSDVVVSAPGFNIEISRSYNSKDTRVSPLGVGWTFGFEGSVKDDTTNPSQLKVAKLPNGSSQVFVKNADGTFTANDSHSKLEKLADNTFRLTTSAQVVYGFDTNGYLSSMTDRNGNKVTIQVDGAGKPVQVTDAVGRIYTMTYNNAARLNSVTDPANRRIVYAYDAANRLISVTDPAGNKIVNYEYDASGYLTKIKDGSQNVLETIVYDHSGTTPTHKVSSYTDSYGMTYTYAYDTANRKTTITDTNGRVIIKWFDAQLFTTKSQDPEGQATVINYTKDANGTNKYGEQNDITDRLGNKTTYTWDANGNITSITNPDNSVQSFTYDSKNNLVSEKDELGKMIYYIYDTNGNNLVQSIRPLNGTDIYSDGADPSKFAISTYSYYTDAEAASLGFGGKGLFKASTDPEGNQTSYTYDAFGNQVSITDPNQNIIKRQYNNIGWLITDWTASGFRTDYTYDANGRLEKKVAQQGQTTRLVYDAQGRKIQEISPNQYVAINDGLNTVPAVHKYDDNNAGSRYTYYPSGKIKTVTDAAGNITQYTYDLYGNLDTLTQPNLSKYAYQYDVMNRQKKAQFIWSAAAGGAAETLETDNYAILPGGKLQKTVSRYLTSDTDKADTIQTFDYAGRVISTQQPDGTTLTSSYNANGTLANLTDANGGKTYLKYDGLNRLTGKWSPITTSLFSYSGYVYDRTGKKLQESVGKDQVSLYSVPVSDRLISHSFSYTKGLLTKELNGLGGAITYSYDNENNVASKVVQSDAGYAQRTDYTYNLFDQPLTSSQHVQAGDLSSYAWESTQDILLTTSFTYDKNGNLLSLTTPDKLTTSYTYDVLNRQTSVSKPSLNESGLPVVVNTSVTYDWAGNVLTQTDGGGRTTTRVYNEKNQLIKSIDALGNTAAFDYDRSGRKTVEVSPENYDSSKALTALNRSEYTYDVMNRLKTKVEKYNEKAFQLNLSWSTNWVERVSKAYLYDNNGNVLKELDGEGYRAGSGATTDSRIQTGYGQEYQYNLANQVVSALDPEGKKAGISAVLSYGYDGAGRKVSETNAFGAVKGYTLDDGGNVTATYIRNNEGAPMQTYQTSVFDNQSHLLKSIDAAGNPTTYTYNSLGKVRSVTVPGDVSIPEDTVQYQYDVLGNQSTKIDSAGITAQYVYDYDSRVIKYTESDPDGKQAISSETRYDKLGNKRFEKDGNGYTTETIYNDVNLPQIRRISVRDVNDAVRTQSTSYTYDKNGNTKSETDSLGNVHQYNYDAVNRLIEVIDPNGISFQKMVYNFSDKQMLSFDALNNLTQFRYDANNRLTSTVDPEGYSTQQYYSENGDVSDQIDGRGNSTHFEYDPFGQLLSVRNSKGESTSYNYDLNGQMLTAIDGNGHVTSYEYNARKLLYRKIDDGGRAGTAGHYTYLNDKVEEYTYTPDGLLESKKDRNGNLFHYDYDVHGRLLSRGADGSSSTPIRFTYDNNGNRLSMTDETGTTQYRYDERNRVISTSLPGTGTNTFLLDQINGVPAGYSYNVTTDVKGNLTKRTYDKTNRLAQVQAGTDQPTTYTYLANGAQQDVTYPNGVKESFTYFKNNKLKTLTNSISGVVKDQSSFTYDASGNMSSKLEMIQGSTKGTTSYTYDSLNRLQSVLEPSGQTTSYQYDAAGNRTVQEVAAGGNVTWTSYAYNEQNRLMNTIKQSPDGSKETANYDYDPNGNLITKSLEQTKKVDAANPPKASFGIFVFGQPNNDPRIANIVNGTATYQYDVWNQLISSKTGSAAVSYQYNGDGYRTKKVVNGDATTYVYENDELSLELDGQGNLISRNVRGTNLISRETKTDKVYFTYNGHEDVTGLVDAAGKLRASYDYDVFGNLDKTRTKYYDAAGNQLADGSASRINNPFRYAGYVFDEDTQLYYLNARYYDAIVGRFTTEDTYSGQPNDPLSLNRYTYVHNEPIMYTDPTGHVEQGDEILTPGAQAKIIALTNAYYAPGTTAAEKKAIQAQATQVRENDKKGNQDQITPVSLEAKNEVKKVIVSALNVKGNMSPSQWNNYIDASNIKVDHGYRTTPTDNKTSMTTTTSIGRTHLEVIGTTDLTISGKDEEKGGSIAINDKYTVTQKEADFISKVAGRSSYTLEQTVSLLIVLEKNQGDLSENNANNIVGSMSGAIRGFVEVDFRTNDFGVDTAELEMQMRAKGIDDAIGIQSMGSGSASSGPKPGLLITERDYREPAYRSPNVVYFNKPPRTKQELDDLATDPAIGNKINDKTIAEREVGLALEAQGKVSGLKRDPSGDAEFIDSAGQKWDVKAYNSNYPPKKGGYTLPKSMESIHTSLSKGENVMVDSRSLSPAHLAELKTEVSKQGLANKVIFWP